MSNLKLAVEVISAHDLYPKESNGSCNPCVELHFDNQKFRTAIKDGDINPHWNELFYFTISDPSSLHDSPLKAVVYHVNKETRSKSAIGKVQISGSSFVSQSDAAVLYYPLEKKNMFSSTKGELGLKVFLTDDPSVRSSSPLPDSDFFQDYQSEDQIPFPNPTSSNIFHHLPREQNQLKTSFMVDEMKSAPQRPTRVFSPPQQQPLEFQLKETRPKLGGGQVVGGRVIPGEKPTSTYDLVEKVEYLFVRVVKARDLPSKDITGSLDPYVELRLGNNKARTKHFVKNQNPEWDEVFAFPIDRLQSSVLEVLVKDKDVIKDDFVGMVFFDLTDLPRRAPPDSPLAPEWYWMVDKKGGKGKGELMLAVWIGTQADECFPIASHPDSMGGGPTAAAFNSLIRSKVYHSPRLWYVRVNIIEAQDIIIADKTRFPDVLVRCQIGIQVLKTKPIQARTMNVLWNEEFMFVAAEPFEEALLLSVVDRVASNKEETIGRVQIHLSTVEKRLDDKLINTKWYTLDKNAVTEDEKEKKREKFLSRLHVRLCLDGGYHVLDESTHYSSDLRPTAKQLWKQSIGLLELGILNADGLPPMKTREGKGSCDSYCVAKYGQKWIRTRTVLNNLSPRYNEQYTWEVYDTATVLTVGVFDNNQFEKGSEEAKDGRIGKVRIRLSTLETGRVYTHSYPLLVLHSSGLKKMGELHLAIRFSSTSLLNTMLIYSKPLLPKLHYLHPLSITQLEVLRNHAVQLVASRLSRMEPPLKKEVVEYMSDVESHLWSMRRSKANFSRFMSVFSGVMAVGRWFGDVCYWKNPITTVLVHVLFVMLVCFPELIVPTIFLYSFLIGMWNYRFRSRHPPHMNTRILQADSVHPDELDEEFDSFPTSKGPELVRMRYDRLRSVAGRMQTVVGDVATQGERLQMLLNWRDPRATAIFLVFCLCSAAVLYVTPFSVLVVVAGFYLMRHPMFRHKMPSPTINFFRRLPARTDSML
ncbi:FT-interacting protein 1-like [Phalaenopsis equestris]|uniref:FT-interacting protein 1-like n=1 Tax=Phalaenopsis equestris TaxID=78828 RepID=UPI0009E3B9B6|nr:FT-interacting protein 1-like [Phalaenopsis equestris]XP_020586793.1 FT-interacting protein 1-like [Phalaenopsis equestris]XP_020586794.1 FT-interacting protein 1-like [Phalaenopsis equestris]